LTPSIGFDTERPLKSAVFLGDTLTVIRGLPDDARSEIGFQPRRIQDGKEPSDWKPMPTIGPGVREIRVREQSGAYRMIYLVATEDGVVVVHVFQKKTQKIAKRDLDLATARVRTWRG
jgi:phage-related protein